MDGNIIAGSLRYWNTRFSTVTIYLKVEFCAMSRCFPFPPPGYEKWPRSEEERDLLKEEKRKERKHKKEKKEKEKKDKDKSDGKHREKREKKDKHRDKKEKHKDKNKDTGLPGPSNGGKLYERDEHKDRHISSEKVEHERPNQIHEDSKFVQELGRRIRNDESQLPERFPFEKIKDSGNSASKNGIDAFRGEVKIRPCTTTKSNSERIPRPPEENVDKGTLPEGFPVEWKRDEKIKNSGNMAQVKEKSKEKGIGDGQAFKGAGANAIRSTPAKGKSEGIPRLLEENVEKGDRSLLSDGFPVEWRRDGDMAQVKEKNKAKGIDVGQAFRGELKIGANAIPSTLAKGKSEGVPRLSEENVENGARSRVLEGFPVEWKIDEKFKDSGNSAQVKEKGIDDGQVFRGELKIGANAILSTSSKSKLEGTNVEKTREEKKKPKERDDDKPREKNKDKKKEKQSHRKQKDKEKEKKKKKEEKAKDKPEQKKIQEDDKSTDINKNSSVVLINNKLPLASKENIAGTVTVGIIGKRKDVETNGFLHESEVRPAKLPRPSSSQQPVQNGKNLDTHPKTDLFSSSKQEDNKLENKEHKSNGQSLPNAKAKVISGADDIAESSKRPPHPDSKHLSEILSVPKPDNWSEFDDQEWLWESKSTLAAKKAKTCPDEANKRSSVWSEALQLDTADVYALPYVIPY